MTMNQPNQILDQRYMNTTRNFKEKLHSKTINPNSRRPKFDSITLNAKYFEFLDK